MAVTAGKWSYWKETDLGEVMSSFCLVLSKPDDCERVYFDRIKRRKIYFTEDIELPPGVVSDIGVFGCPAPIARFVEIIEGKGEKEHQASHWLYPEQDAKRGTVGQRAPTPTPDELPRRPTISGSYTKSPAPPASPTPATDTPIRSPPVVRANEFLQVRPIPTEPRAHRLARETCDAGIRGEDSSLGRRTRTPSMSVDASEDGGRGVQPKKLRGAETPIGQAETVEATNLDASSKDTPSMPAPRNPEEPDSSSALTVEGPLATPSVRRTPVETLANDSSDSRFLCFEGLPFDWESCCSWLFSRAVSSHFVWIKRIFRTEADSLPLIWLDMGSNDDACKIRGYLTHRTTQDNSLVISHFVSESTFNEAVLSHTHLWERPTSIPQTSSDDPMEGPSLPLENRLTSPSPSPSMPDVSLLHRAGVTLEERVEGVLPPRRQRGGVKHRKYNAKQLAKQQSRQ